MSISQFVLGIVRLAAILLPVLVAARRVRRWGSSATGAQAWLIETVLALGLLLVGAELLGLVSLLRPWPLCGLFALTALASLRLAPGGRHARGERSEPRAPAVVRPVVAPLLSRCTWAGVIVVGAQWCLASANSLGSGMLNFDTLWYHMPFAARFAQTGSVTGLLFTQADAITAYYPANSELLHGIGIAALGSDFISPVINLLWLVLALVACWCFGRRWQVSHETLLAGCLLLGLPVLSATQPGEAFNDVPGLALMLAALALLVTPEGGGDLSLFAAGVALGLAAGTKYTLVAPAIVLLFAAPWLCARGARARAFALLGIPMALTGSFWYLRALALDGNPLGLRTHLGPITLPGPSSPIAKSLEQTVISQLSHVSLWTSRFAPGLAHALGIIWPVLLLGYIGVLLGGFWLRVDRAVGVMALCAAAGGLAYLVFPTGATHLAAGTYLFEVNLRYAMPALGIAVLLLPVLVRLRCKHRLASVAPTMLALLLVAQLARSLWPSQPPRHLLFLCGGVVLALVIDRLPPREHVVRAIASRPALAVLGAGLALLGGGGVAYGVQRHYFSQRYRIGGSPFPGAAVTYSWAQHIEHARIALYGLIAQYPLYGRLDTNRVDYMGQRTPDGGYRALASCQAWREALNRGRYDYVVMGIPPVGTPVLPQSWTSADPSARRVLRPEPFTSIYKLTGAMSPGRCPRPDRVR